MRSKAIFATLIMGFLPLLSSINLFAQVAPAATVGRFPIGVGIGVSGYNLDYGPGRWMEGVVARGSVGLYHGIGIDGSARTIFINTPTELTRMQQSTYLGGVFYEAPSIHRVRPFVRVAGGLGVIEFPSRDPFYTRDSYSVYALGGGVETPLSRRFYLRGEYEYQVWKDYHGPHNLTPQGVTLGITYYLRTPRLRPHSSY